MIYIVTVATHEAGYMKWLKLSCQKNGCELVVLGNGLKWEGYTMRFKLMLEFCKTKRDDDIICFVDAYDVLMMKHVDKLEEKFLKIQKKHPNKVIISKHGNLSLLGHESTILNNISDKQMNIKAGFDHLNIGTYIGYNKNIKKILKWCFKKCEGNQKADDSILINEYYSIYKKNIYVDTKCKFFYLTLEVIDKNSYDTNAFFIHKPGNTPMVNLIKSEGYTITDYEYKIINKNALDALKKKAIYYLKAFKF